MSVASAEFIDAFFASTGRSQAQFDSLANNALGKGIDLYQNGDYAGAARMFRSSIGFSPFTDNAASAYDYMAKAFQQLEKTEDAIRVYKEAISVYPTRDSFHIGLGDVYLSNKQLAEAEKEYTAAIRLDPNVTDSRYALGQVYLDQGRAQEAAVQFQRVISLSPNSASGYYALGQALRKSGDLQGAEAELNRALSKDKNFDNAVRELGYTYADMGDMDKAAEQASILSARGSSFAAEVQGYIYESSAPKFVLAYSTNGFNTANSAGTPVSGLDFSLSEPNAKKNFTMRFGFSKEMDISSVENLFNWDISRAIGSEGGGAYNWGLKTPSSEVNIAHLPVSVRYNAETNSADVTFAVAQNSTGDGTIDPSHIMFRFRGMDNYGKAMDTTADQYSRFSKIV